MTVTVHVLHVQTQKDPLIVHVRVFTLEMAELAFYHQVIRKKNNEDNIIRKIFIYQTRTPVSDAPCNDLGCLNGVLRLKFICRFKREAVETFDQCVVTGNTLVC